MAERALDDVVAAIFGDGVRELAALPGGLTNANHKVTTDAGVFVLRRWSDDSGLLAIDRDAEHVNSVRAAEAGVGARVHAYAPELNAMAFEYLDGPTMSARQLRSGEHLEQVAAACRRLHAAAPFAGDFDMFAVQPRYRAIVAERGYRVPERYDEFAAQVAAVQAAFAVRAEPPVPCNNDLLAENFLLVDGELRLIDYEYAGNNDACFELGNICSESGLSVAQLETLVGAYYGRPLRHKVARARLWGTIAKYGWTMWASIQDGVSAIDFDFWAWGMEKYERAVAEFDDPGFDALLQDARATD